MPFGIFTAFATLLKLLWPFFKEAMLQDGTMRDWLRRNRNTCIWILFQLIMLAVTFFLVEMITNLRVQDYVTSQKLDKLQVEHQALKEKETETAEKLRQELASAARVRIFMVNRCKLYPEPCQFLIEETLRREEDAGREPTAAQKDEAKAMWCGVVRDKDLNDDSIRQRYLRECSVNQRPATQPATS